jgi:3-oxoacyl-[acyl-carrier protein] reductase
VSVALVTGAARGIGLATAQLLLEQKFQVIGLDREFPAGYPAAIKPVTYDLTDIAGIPALVGTLGRIDALVNNAGMQNAVPIERYTEAQRRRILQVNLEAPVELIRALAPQMIGRKSGRIVSLASIAAYQPHPDLWYGVSKAGIVSMTKSFASYLGPHGIQVNAVAPGPVDTELLKVVDPARVAALTRSVLSGRVGRAGEIAQAIVWLLTASPQILNGATLDVNDGTYPR